MQSNYLSSLKSEGKKRMLAGTDVSRREELLIPVSEGFTFHVKRLPREETLSVIKKDSIYISITVRVQ